MATSAGRGGTAGFGLSVTPWQYARTEPGVILHYLRLSFWPTGLVLDYHWPFANTLGQILPGAIVVAALLAATLWALVRRPAAGFLGACFFLILTPSSSVIPLFDAAVEHRMYLALAAVLVLAVVLLHLAWQRLGEGLPSSRGPSFAKKAVPTAMVAIAAGALGYATWQRNQDYRSALAVWQDVVAKSPDNYRARFNLGGVFSRLGKPSLAIPQYERAAQLKPDYAQAQENLGVALALVGRAPEAIPHYQRALQLKSDYAEAEKNLGATLALMGKGPEAIAHYERALQLNPDYPDAESNLGLALALAGRVPEAIRHFERARQLQPDDPQVENNLGVALSGAGRVQEAIPHFERALQLKPDDAEARNNLAKALSSQVK